MSFGISNYGGKIPTPTQYIKQFVDAGGSQVTWIYKNVNGKMVETPADSSKPVYINNDLYVTGSIFNTSDARLKENVVNISEVTSNDILMLNPVEYNFKLDITKSKHYGFIAQDVENMYPHLVKPNILGYKSVNYIELIPLLLSRMKCMQNEIDNLKTRLDMIEDIDT